MPDAEETDQRIELVGQSGCTGDRALRQDVTGKARTVVLFDGIGHRRHGAFVQRVVAPHDALQFGELANHVGEQIDLAEQGRAIGKIGVGAEHFGSTASDAAKALGTVSERTELVVIDHRAKLHRT